MITSTKHFIDMKNDTELKIEYIVPYNDLQEFREDRIAYFSVAMAMIIFTTLIGIMGAIVEHTKLGNIKLNCEDTNFSNIDIPII